MTTFLARLDARDRALFTRWTIAHRGAHPAATSLWRLLTHLGGATICIAVALGASLLASGPVAAAGRVALATLTLSHLMVQIVKRTVGRPRPRGIGSALITAPDRFSFPSGHAAAAASIAIGFGLLFPAAAPALGSLAVIVGASRVVLGVHYPGDVVAGQFLAVLAAVLIRGW